MASSSAPSDPAATAAAAGVVIDEDLEQPVNGSWVAELEVAKADLSAALRDIDDGGDAPDATAQAAVLHAYRRLCRAYKMLRRWDRLLIVSKKGLKACAATSALARRSPSVATPTSDPSTPPDGARAVAAAVAAAKPSFLMYQKQAEDELTDQTAHLPTFDRFGVRIRVVGLRLLNPEVGDGDGDSSSLANVKMLQKVVLRGDIRQMEAAVARGAPIDQPIEQRPIIHSGTTVVNLPPAESLLLTACTVLAIWASIRPEISLGGLDRIAECAMQLVNLGADLNQKIPEGMGLRDYEGKSPCQIAVMSRRRPLVALMVKHLQLSQEERSEVVHCRCGSRLPWKQCHSTGAGQPSHWVHDSATGKPCYRVSALSRCPCNNTSKPYFKCCWKDNRAPVYLHDDTGALLCRSVDALSLPTLGKCLRNLEAHDPEAADILLRTRQEGSSSWIGDSARHFREHPSLFKALCQDVSPKSSMTTWHPQVYAGCLERLENPFLWRDVHWDLDRSVLLRQSKEWNEALDKYCVDVGLEGAERELVVRTHEANKCGPCGCVGCSAYEGKAFEFRRCAGCMAICYCSRKCQKKHWGEHQKVCQTRRVVATALVPYFGTAPIDLGLD